MPDDAGRPLDVAAAAEAVVAAARAATPRCGDVVVVAIDGPSGSGKTTLADAVVADLGCPLVRMDDLYPGWEGLAEGVATLARDVLAPLAAGRPARHPVWDWHASRWGADREVVVPPTPEGTRLLVVEGCGASASPAGSFAAVRVWVDAPRTVRRRRGLARDGAAYAPHWDRWAAQEEALFRADDTRRRADLVLHT